MSSIVLFTALGSALIGVGLYGTIVGAQPLRRVISFNVLAGGAFLLLGAVARRGAGAGYPGDPVPQALLITALVVAFAATALAVALLLRGASLPASDTDADGD